MKRVFVLLALLTAFMSVGVTSAQSPRPVTTIQITDDVLLEQPKNLGINIGFHDQFGASQILKNLLPNPGFEGSEVGSIFLAAAGASGNRIQAQGWTVKPIRGNENPISYWQGGELEILTGAGQGRNVAINDVTLDDGRFTFHLQFDGVAPAAGDVIAVRGPERPSYYKTTVLDNVTYDRTTARPGSSGDQALRVSPSDRPNQPDFYKAFDSTGRDGARTAGKLRIVDGAWNISYWIKAEHPGMKAIFTFKRDNGVVFHKETVGLTTEWQHVQRTMFIPAGVDTTWRHRVLLVGIEILDSAGDVWVDDMVIQRSDHKNPTAFSDNFVNALKQLNPGVIRDWGLQMGSSLDNQLADPFARLTTGYHPHDTPRNWHYSLHEFLELAQHVGAEPYYVMPPTWSSQEITNFIAYLAAPAGSHPYANRRAALGQPTPWTHVFKQIHIEFGNELWGYNADWQPGQGFAMDGAIRVGDAANARFHLMRVTPHFNPNKFNLIIGGQVNFPDFQGQVQRRSGTHDSFALAPYFGDLDRFATDAEKYGPLFAAPSQDVNIGGRVMQARQSLDWRNGEDTELVIYEINTQLDPQGAPLDVTNDWYTSLGTGLALPLHMLTYQRDMGINTQMAFTALQYATPYQATWHNVWGLLRDVEATQLKRPGWLGMELANYGIQGNMVETVVSGANPGWTQQPMNTIIRPIHVPYIQAFAYRGWGAKTSIILFNLSLNQEQQVNINLPTSVTPFGKATIKTLTADDINANNETGNNVQIVTDQQFMGGWSTVIVPPHSMMVVRWDW